MVSKRISDLHSCGVVVVVVFFKRISFSKADASALSCQLNNALDSSWSSCFSNLKNELFSFSHFLCMMQINNFNRATFSFVQTVNMVWFEASQDLIYLNTNLEILDCFLWIPSFSLANHLCMNGFVKQLSQVYLFYYLKVRINHKNINKVLYSV